MEREVGRPRLRDLFESSEHYSVKWSSYFTVYEHALARFVGKGITFVEVGVASGASLLMWKAYLQNARIIGIDNDPAASELTVPGVEIVIGDQASPEFWKQFYRRVGPIDVLVDDGGHTNEQQIVTVTQALDNIRDTGLVLVEDVHASYMGDFLNPARHSFINFAKHLVDAVNSRAPFAASPRPYRDIVSSLEFHESIVVIHIDRRQAIESVQVECGTAPPPAAAETSSPRRGRLRFLRSIPFVGSAAAHCAMRWDRLIMNRRLSRHFRSTR